jgi:CRP/FNR family transcriptional regulator
MNTYSSALQESGQTYHESASYFTSILESEDNVHGWGHAQLYQRNTEVYHQDTPANAVYLIERGLVKLTWVEPDGREVIVGLRRRHWLLGAQAVLLGRRLAFTVTTLIPCSLHSISSTGFLNLVNTDAEFNRQLLLIFSEEIYRHGMKAAVLGCMPARDRLTRFLCEMVLEQRNGSGAAEPHKPMKLQIPIKLKELAQLIAITPEHLSRLLKELEQQGVIKRNNGWLILTDPDTLVARQK